MTTNTENVVFAHEDTLPQVPVPSLADSCERFVEWCSPLLTEDELDRTLVAVDAFLAPDSPAHALQAELEDYAGRQDVHSWLDDFWRVRYLGRRDRIALNANTFCLYDDAKPSGDQLSYEGPQFDRAAAIIAGAVDHKVAVDEGRLLPTERRGQLLSMEQHKHIWATTRIPAAAVDNIRTPYSPALPGPSTERHAMVFVRGHVFRLDVIGPEDHPHPPAAIARALRELSATAEAPGQGVGRLTTMDRAEWARQRQRLLSLDPHNGQLLETVESALFAVCLDDLAVATPEETCRALLIGDATNRWFDTATSFVVFTSGRAGQQVEHALIDGTTTSELCDWILAATAEEHSTNSGARPQGPPAWEELEFVLDPDMVDTIERAGTEYDEYGSGTAIRVLTVDGFGSTCPKALGMSPDALCQLAFQLAHQRARGFIGTTYESISTRHFHHGRTEAMRVVTPEILAFVAAMDNPETDRSTRLKAARSAAEKHVQRARECQVGEAPEQHLWCLQMMHERQGGPRMHLYDSPGWGVMRDDRLSTSSVGSRYITTVGFGPTSDQCIGIAYSLLPDRLTLHLTTPQTIAGQLDDFADGIRQAISELAALLEESVP